MLDPFRGDGEQLGLQYDLLGGRRLGQPGRLQRGADPALHQVALEQVAVARIGEAFTTIGPTLDRLWTDARGAAEQAFAAIGRAPLEAAATLRASPWDAFFSVALPLARPGFVTAGVLGFAHTVGEFGVVLMIGGNIPDQTRVVSVQIYDHVEALEYARSHWLAGCMVVFSFLVLLLLYTLKPQAATGRGR